MNPLPPKIEQGIFMMLRRGAANKVIPSKSRCFVRDASKNEKI